jgi:glucokinase
MILAGDVGGTKTLLALYQQQGSEWICIKKQQFASADFTNFTDVLTAFLVDETVTHVCIGVAGPVVDGDCRTTNLPWFLKNAEIAAQTGAIQVLLLNDLAAMSWGVLNLPDSDFVELNPAAKIKQGNIAVLAAGTGLGEAIVAWDGQKHHVIATEGGNTDFAPNNEEEITLLRYLMGIYPEHVCYERVLSGTGLMNLYQFLKSIDYAPVNGKTEQQMQEIDPAAVISALGMSGEDALCVKALTMFCRIYGAEASNLALKCLPYGGVILAGGIAAKILPFIQQGEFMRGFLAKGRYQAVLESISVKICINSEAALWGARFRAMQAVKYQQTYP